MCGHDIKEARTSFMSMKNNKWKMLIHPGGKEGELGKENPEGFSYPGNVWNG